MGTVPHPLGPAKLSLASPPEEKDCPGDLLPAKHQPKVAAEERASNGFPCSVPGSAATRTCSLKRTGTQEACCKEDANQQAVLLPSLSSQAVEGCLAGIGPAPAVEAAGCGPDMMPAPQSSQQFVQGGQAKASPLAQVEDSALKPQGTEEQPALQVLQCSSPGSPARGNESCLPSQASLLQREGKEREAEADAAACQPASPVRDRDAATDAGRDPQAAVVAKSGSAGPEQLCPADQTEAAQSSTAAAQLSCEGTHPLCDADTEQGSSGPTQLSKFKETGTMTVQSESSSLTQEAASRTWRDAEVQAVATVENKSASTSPSILAAFLKGNPPSEEKEELHIIYQGSGGLSQSELVNSFSSQQKPPCSPGTVSKLTGVTAGAATAQSQPAGLPAAPPDAVSLGSADNAEPTVPFSPAAITSRDTAVDNTEGTGPASSGEAASALPTDAAALSKPVPAQQLAISPSDQTTALSAAGEINITAAARTESKVQCLVHDTGSSQLPSLCNLQSETKQNEALGGSEQKPAPCKGVNEVEAIPQSVVKPKGENLMVLDAQAGANAGREPVSGKACSEEVGEKEQSSRQGEMRPTPMASRQALPVGPVAAPSSGHVTPLLEVSAAPQQAKESKRELHAAALPSSVQALPNRGENKKQTASAMEAKVQVKQSKHVRDVVWDEQGMTWEVYGASLDPESLGIAIQNHLQRQIREHEKLIRSQNSQNRKSISSDTSSNKKLKGRQHNIFQSMLQNFRRPNCCVRPAPSSVLD
nr:LOW QUALITY PROTEIN: G protein-regulated inducer of neurite outgrowth 3 [Anas platyrhynchos]